MRRRGRASAPPRAFAQRLSPPADGTGRRVAEDGGMEYQPRQRLPLNPALMEHARARAQSFENRIADRITAFSGSMRFVYLHAIWFACWIGFRVEPYPFGLLTMIVSLEAIFLSTFVMISQNRADAKREVLANQQWQTVLEEDGQNKELLRLSNQILALTKAVHAYAAARSDGGSPQPVGDGADAPPTVDAGSLPRRS
jgi:uncharacterized membrane protein